MPILFAWDFHGTLEQDNEFAVIEASNQSLIEHGYDVQVTQQDLQELYGRPWGDYFRKLVPRISDAKVEELVARSRQLGLPAAGRHCKPRVHAHSTLKKIMDEGHTNIIVSNATQRDLEFFMKITGVTPYIHTAYGVNGNKHKTIINHPGTYSRIIMIGDTENDIKAGKRANATTYLVQNGEPRPTEADYVITDLRDVLKELTNCDHKQ